MPSWDWRDDEGCIRCPCAAESRPGWDLISLSREHSLEYAAQMASVTLRQYDVVCPPVPLNRILEKLEIRLCQAIRPGWLAASAKGNFSKAIWVDSAANSSDQRFAVAHELGHLLLHDMSQPRRCATLAGDHEEREANEFAASLLVPMSMVEDAAPLLAKRGLLASDLFQAPENVVNFQLRKLLGQGPEWP